ncbi:hypothetical protein ACLOJK_012507 [Asimina triloba]
MGLAKYFHVLMMRCTSIRSYARSLLDRIQWYALGFLVSAEIVLDSALAGGVSCGCPLLNCPVLCVKRVAPPAPRSAFLDHMILRGPAEYVTWEYAETI